MDSAPVLLKTEAVGTFACPAGASLCDSRFAPCKSPRLLPRGLRLKVSAYVGDTGKSSPIPWQGDFDTQYRTGKVLGKGSFGEVFQAADRHTCEKVAVKEMPLTRESLSEERTLQNITREVMIMNRMEDCPGVAKLLGCFRLSDRYRIVMEFCDGGDLTSHLKAHGPFSEAQAALVAYEVLKAVCACHDQDIVHGDVKTANFVLNSRQCNPFLDTGLSVLRPGWIKAIDFGCSQFVGEFVRIRSRVGSPVFMAPEVYERNYGFESDLWSLGILLYQLVTSRFPFWNIEEAASIKSLDDVISMVMSREPDFDYGSWMGFSAEGIDFLQGLLDKSYLTRMTADEAVHHPWIRKHIRHDSHGGVLLNNIVPTGTTLGDAATRELVLPGQYVP